MPVVPTEPCSASPPAEGLVPMDEDAGDEEDYAKKAKGRKRPRPGYLLDEFASLGAGAADETGAPWRTRAAVLPRGVLGRLEAATAAQPGRPCIPGLAVLPRGVLAGLKLPWLPRAQPADYAPSAAAGWAPQSLWAAGRPRRRRRALRAAPTGSTSRTCTSSASSGASGTSATPRALPRRPPSFAAQPPGQTACRRACLCLLRGLPGRRGRQSPARCLHLPATALPMRDLGNARTLLQGRRCGL